MRDTTATIDNAIDSAVSFKFIMKATIEPSYIYIDTIDNNNPIANPDASGIIDEPRAQDISVSPTSGSLVTWYNTSGTLRYIKQGSNNEIATSQSVTTKPGVFGNTLFVAEFTQIYKRAIDWSVVEAEGANPFTSDDYLGIVSGNVTAIHGISNTQCSVIAYAQGGMRVYIFDGSTMYTQPGRFMFPRAVDYSANTTTGSERSYNSLGIFSGAFLLGNEIVSFVSNPHNGSVEGVAWNTVTHVWSDIFVAVSTDLQSSFCEFRIANAYSYHGTGYLVGQFRRTENIGTDSVYSLILSTQDSRIFSLASYALVSKLGYRFLALSYNGRLYIGNCNRVSSRPLTWVFAGSSGSEGLILDIPTDDFISFRDSNSQQSEFNLRAGNDYYAFHSYVREGSRVKLYSGYNTTAGDEYVLQGTYIIEAIENAIAQGERSVLLSLLNSSEWLLTGLSSPYYTEFFSKSSVYDTLTEESGNLYVAPGSYDVRDHFVVDFWNHSRGEGFFGESVGWFGTEIILKGGVTHDDHVQHSNEFMQCQPLDEVFDLAEPVEFTGDAVEIDIYGWSHDDAGGGGENDELYMVFWIEKSSGSDSGKNFILKTVSADHKHWEQSYPNYEANDGFPVTFTITTSTALDEYAPEDDIERIGYISEGDKLLAIGLGFKSYNDVDFCPARIEVKSGVRAKFIYSDSNTPWEQTGDGLKVPGPIRPYIMFSQKPYDAWNFFQAGEFTNTVGGYVSTYPCACGFVGLAMDGTSYICGRYNKSNNKWEIVKVRDSQETVLNSIAAGTIPTTFTMAFSHIDGAFSIWYKTGGFYSKVLSYTWDANDGWMYESETISKKCGIYGIKNVPWFEICGLDSGSIPDRDNADGIPYLPGYDVADWPSSGRADVGDNEFVYYSKVEANPVLGPHQFRNSGQYEEPYGNGDYGLECLFFDWEKSNSSTNGLLCASDNGGVYKISGADFRIWNSTAGDHQNLHNRARFYSDNEMIAKSTKMLSNRIYITGGLKDIGLVKGLAKRHRKGSICSYHVDGDISCSWYRASSGKSELTLRDLINDISHYSGAEAEFPGDTIIATATPGAGVLYGLGSQQYVEGFDVSFSIDDLSTNDYVELVSDVVITPTSGSDNQALLRITKTDTSEYRASLYSLPSSTLVDSIEFNITTPIDLDIRFIFHDDFATVDIGDCWYATFGCEKLTYDIDCALYLRSSANTQFNNIRVVDLSDWREAVYIDLETDGKSAVGSVIQERPIDVHYRSNGSIAYWYSRIRDRVTQVIEPRRHVRKRQFPRNCGSDAIVYYSDVAAIQNSDFVERYGFSTKVYRFPSLTVGAIRAAKIQMNKLLESAYMHSISMRPDVRLEIGDVLDIDYYAGGTQTHIQVSVIVENCSLSYSASDNNPTMQVSGREEL